jgi:uncharacterized protein (TIRG00374 family)
LLALLVWQLPDFEVSELFPTFTASTWLWLIAATFTLLFAFGLQTLRWDAVLVAMGYHLRYRRLFSEFLAGQFVSNVLPTAFAGDVVRIARVGKDIDDFAHAFASVALERLTGWLVLPSISLIAFAVSPELRSLGTASKVAIAINVVTLVALVIVLAIAANRRWSNRANLATGWRRWLASLHLGIDAIRERPKSIAAITGAGVAFQITQCLSIWMVAKALEMPQVTLLAALAFVPPTLIGQNLPVGFGGLGVREVGFVLFFGAMGADDSRAVALGLVTYLITVLASATGAPFLASGGEKWRDVLSNAEQAEDEGLVDTQSEPEAT